MAAGFREGFVAADGFRVRHREAGDRVGRSLICTAPTGGRSRSKEGADDEAAQPNEAAMRAGRKAHGYNLSFPSPWVIDILGKLDFDFVFIDGEHGPFGLDQLEDLCRTAERHNLTAIARVPDIGSSTIRPYLDRGSCDRADTSVRRRTPASSCGLAISVRSVSGHSGPTGVPTTMPGLPTRRPTTARQTNRCWCALCWKMLPC